MFDAVDHVPFLHAVHHVQSIARGGEYCAGAMRLGAAALGYLM